MLRPTQHQLMTHYMFPGATCRCYVLHSTSEEAHDTFYVSRSRL